MENIKGEKNVVAGHCLVPHSATVLRQQLLMGFVRPRLGVGLIPSYANSLGLFLGQSRKQEDLYAVARFDDTAICSSRDRCFHVKRVKPPM